MKKNILIIKLVFSTLFLFAKDTHEDRILRLYEQENFSACQSLIDKLPSDYRNNEDMMYLNAKCSQELFLEDAIKLYEDLKTKYPSTKYMNQIYIDLSLIHYRNKNYYSTVSSINEIHNPSTEDLFRLAYSNFCIDSLDEAQYIFSKIMQQPSRYKSAAKYYYAHILYLNNNYRLSLIAFEDLLSNEKFGKIVPYYISQIYFQIEDYSSLIKFTESIINQSLESRKPELLRLLAESHYHLKKYDKAIFYFESLINYEKYKTSNVFFMLGHSYHEMDDFENSVRNLEFVVSSNDSIQQYSSYYLGASYLQLGYLNYSLQAFKKSSQFNYSLDIKENALLNYAKLSYQLDLPFDNTLKILNDYESFFVGNENQKIDELKALVFQYSNKHKEAYDLLKNEQNPNLNQRIAFQKSTFSLAVQSFNQKDFSEAINFFNLSLKFPIDNNIYYLSNFWLADCYYHQSDFRNSIEKYIYVKSLNFEDFDYYNSLLKYNVAYAYFQIKDYANSLKWFLTYIDHGKILKSDSETKRNHDANIRIADSYFMMSDFKRASEYYKKTSEDKIFDTDYCLYQYSKTSQLLERYSVMVTALNQIVEQHKQSGYYTYALYDLANYYYINSNFDKSIVFFDSLISSSNDENLIADSYLNKGNIHYKRGEFENSINCYLVILNSHANTKYFNLALSSARKSYTSLGKLNEYFDMTSQLSGVNISESEQDSITYQAGFMKYLEENYTLSLNIFNNYLKTFKDAIYLSEASYYSAICCLNLGDTNQAIEYYDKAANNTAFSNREKALIFLARNSLKRNQMLKANDYYSKLYSIATSNSISRECVINLMTINSDTDLDKSAFYASKVIEFNKVDDWLLSKALIILSRHEFSRANYFKAKTIFERIVILSNYDEGAEAKYFLAYLSYLDSNYTESERLIFELANNYTSTFYISKSFILLSDIYCLQNKFFQAIAVLESVIDNSEEQIIVDQAKEKINLIKRDQSLLLSNQKKDESQKIAFLEIYEDEIDYVYEQDSLMIAPKLDSIKSNKIENEIY